MCLGGFFLHRKLNASSMSSFVITICFGALFVWVFALFNVIYVGVTLFYGACFLLGMWQVFSDFKKHNLHKFANYFNVSTILFLISCFLFLVIYVVQNPLYHYWDEYSFWGTAARQTRLTGSLPIVENFGLNDFGILPTGAATLTFLFSAFSKGYNDYVLYFAYTVVTLALFALSAEFAAKKAAKPFADVAVFLFFVVAAFFQTYHAPTLDFNNTSYAYGTAMVDFLLAIYVVLAVLVYISNKGTWLRYTYILPALLACITKDVGIVFAMLATCVIACFELFIKQPATSEKTGKIKGAIKLAIKVILILVSFIIYFSINSFTAKMNYMYTENEKDNVPHAHISVTAQSLEYYQKQEQEQEQEEIETPTETPVDEQVLTTDAQPTPFWLNIIMGVFSPNYRTPRQNEVINDMYNQFTTQETTFHLVDTIMVAILLVTGFICSFFYSKKYRTALLIANIGVSVGALLYIFAISYFIAGFADGMVEYSRYMTTYYWFWMCLVLTLAFKFAAEKNKTIFIVALSVGLTAWLFVIGLDRTVINSPDNHYAAAHEAKTTVSVYEEQLSASPRVLMIADRKNDYNYNLYRHNLLPSYINVDLHNTGIDFSAGFSNEEHAEMHGNVFTIVTDEEFLTIASENFDYVFIAHGQDEFVLSFSEYFTSPIEQGKLYAVKNNDNEIYFEEFYAYE